jgi:hypothetical protein
VVCDIGTRLLNQHSRLGIHLVHGALTVASKPTLRGLAAKLFAREPKSADLSATPFCRPDASAGNRTSRPLLRMSAAHLARH